MELPALLIFPLAVFLAVMFGSRTLIRRLSERAILDHPNDRSSHTAPTPRGAGIAVVGALLPAWALIGAVTGQLTEPLFLVAGMALVLAVVSWIDDLRGLSPLVRIGVQAAAIAAVMTLAPPTAPVFGGLLPPALDHLAAGLIWLWFVNLYNFMDGIDGLAGVETLAIGVGAFVVARKLGLGGAQMALALTLAAAALGFLRWNWHPAKIFLGDVGSIPLGFLTGWLLLNLAAAGAWAPALILPLYFLADATWTLARRGLQGRRIWEAHREHFYQRAVDSGLRHDQVTWIIAVANMFLVMLSLVAMRGQPIAALLGAAAAITLLLVLLAKGGPTD